MHKSSTKKLLAAIAANPVAVLAMPLIERQNNPSVHLAGDSTMAPEGGGSGTIGWGEYLQYSLSTTVDNRAIGGRSARSYTREGRFDDIASDLVAGDFVVIEFGHNDGGSLTPTDNGRTDCPGDGDEVCNTDVESGILTYVAYLENAARKFTDLGAYVIVSSPTPNNPWETGTFAYAPNRFTGYSEMVANEFENAIFIDHGQLVANEFERLGASTVDTYFPNDHTHTSPEGADVVAQAFVRGLLCSDGQLAQYVINSTSSVIGSCL
ncbi:hypothetical protein KC345_g5841 [Hortaea werneckii]|nr:hypothetical protein KC345_g5841 [Hortaea werneckii]